MSKPSSSTTGHPPGQLVLASTSPFRRELMVRLGLDFTTASPHTDETRLANEDPNTLVCRLAEAKAKAVSAQFPESLIIGSDQVACIDERILGKPGNRDNAIMQLTQASGRKVTFLTGLCLLNPINGKARVICEPFHVHFRNLSQAQVVAYVDREQPYNCAGSFKSEGLGIALFERLEGDDPTALIGLPLIRLIRMLEHEGVFVLSK